MTLLEDIATYLTDAGVVSGDGIDVYRNFQPEAPNNMVSLHEYQGDPVSVFTDVVHRSVQVVVRNESAEAAQRLAIKLFKALAPTNETQRVDFTATRWGQVHIRQVPYKIMQDESNRTHYGFNLGITTTIDE